MSASEELCRYCGAFVNVPRGAPYRYLGTVLFPEPPAGMSAEEYHEHARCVDVEPMREEQSTCRYSLRHAQAGVVATTTIDCGPVGIVPACEACAAFYARNSS